jgi:hypothetical protein
MKYTKGQSGNPNGRPKGSPNKIPADVRALLMCFVNDGFEKFEKDFDSLTPKQYCAVYLKLLALVLPKPQPEPEEREPVEYVLRMVTPDGKVKEVN